MRIYFLFNILFSISAFALALIELKADPVILIPGDGGSQIEAKLDKSEVVHYVCSKKSSWFNIWLNMELLVPFVIDCWVDNMKLVYNNVTRRTTNNKGVDIRIPGFGNSTTVEWLDPSKASPGNYFASIAEAIIEFGYERNISIRGAPYDFRKAPNENEEYFVNMKLLVEDTYKRTRNKKVVLISHSMGSPMMLYFLNHQTQKWKDQFIKSWISLAGCFSGTVKALKVFAEGDDLGVSVLSEGTLREQQRTSPSLSWLMPSDKFWAKEEILVEAQHKNYTVNDYFDFFNDINFSSGYEMWLDTRHLTYDLTPPGVEVHCLYGNGVDTAERLMYTKTTPEGKATFKMGDGDGTVNIRSLAACQQWAAKQQQPVYSQSFPKRDHMAVLKDPDILTYIRNVLRQS